MRLLTHQPRILVVAATARELAPVDGWLTLLCGIGPVEAAAATVAAIASHSPDAILHVGIAGARRGRALAPSTIVIGSEARYCDLSLQSELAPRLVAASPLLLTAARSALPDAPVRTIATTARVGGTSERHAELDVEAMEGFGVLRAAQLAGVPAIEVRAISNEIEEVDRARWHFNDAFDAITAATPLLVAAIRDALQGAVAPVSSDGEDRAPNHAGKGDAHA